MASDTATRMQENSGTTSSPRARHSQSIHSLRRLRARPGCTQLRRLYNQPRAISSLPTRSVSANRRVDDKHKSAHPYFSASRLPTFTSSYGVSPIEASWSVINSKYELHLSDESPNIHLPSGPCQHLAFTSSLCPCPYHWVPGLSATQHS